MNKFNKVYNMIMEEIKINMPNVKDMTKDALNKVDNKINSLVEKDNNKKSKWIKIDDKKISKYVIKKIDEEAKKLGFYSRRK